MSDVTTAWPSLPNDLATVTVNPDDARYQRVRSTYMAVGSPRAVVMASHEEQVAAAVRYAADVRGHSGTEIAFSVRSGGHGYFVRSQGMTVDRVRRVRLLTADGQIRWVDADHEPDLFWAVRGGATQVGIALAFEFEAQRMNSRSGQAGIIDQEVNYLIDDLGDFTHAWGDWMRQAPREAVSFLMVQRTPDGRFVAGGRTVWANDDAQAATPTLSGALQIGNVLNQNAMLTDYAQIVPTPRSPHVGQQRIVMRNVLVDQPTEDAGAALAQALEHPAVAVGEIRALGGAVTDVDPSATAWAGRHQEALMAIWAQPRPPEVIDDAFDALQGVGTGMYGAYSSDTRSSAANLAWPGQTGERLRQIATSTDPDALFDRGLTARSAAVAA